MNLGKKSLQNYRNSKERIVVINVVIDARLRDDEPRFLITRGRDGMFRTPGGEKNISETLREAACRETLEETGSFPDALAIRRIDSGATTANINGENLFIATYYGDRHIYFGSRRPRRKEPNKLGPWIYVTARQASRLVEIGKLYRPFFDEITAALERYKIDKEDEHYKGRPSVSVEPNSFLWYIHNRDR